MLEKMAPRYNHRGRKRERESEEGLACYIGEPSEMWSNKEDREETTGLC